MNAAGKPVIRSFEDASGMQCLDIACHAADQFSIKVFRKDPEDEGKWTLVADYSQTRYASEREAYLAACERLPWLDRTALP